MTAPHHFILLTQPITPPVFELPADNFLDVKLDRRWVRERISPATVIANSMRVLP